jgi:organic radical activating enzyme
MGRIKECVSVLQGEGKYVGVPHILIRLAGCSLRCAFGNSICDTPYASWKVEKEEGDVSEQYVYDFFATNSQIKHTMITGGEPFLDISYLEHVVSIAKKFNHFVTVETSGIYESYKKLNIDFLSVSPKLKNSIPLNKKYVVGCLEIYITDSQVKQHCKLISNLKPLENLLEMYTHYQIKPVIFDIAKDMKEVKKLIKLIGADKSNVYLMPAGSTREELQQVRVPLTEYCIEEGWNFTDRSHIVAYNNRRGV